MSNTLTTMIVLLANGSMAVIAAMLLMLVLWQAPHQRINRMFAGVMALVMVYSIVNGFGRFIDELDLDATQVMYAAINLYGLFTVAMFFFATEYVGIQRLPLVRLMRAVALIGIFTQSALLWQGELIFNIRPIAPGAAGYQSDWSFWGRMTAGFMVLFHSGAALLFYRMRDPRARAFWRAPALIVLAALSATYIWPYIQLPFNAIFLMLATASLGVPVLQYELFNPQVQMHHELEQRDTELQETSALKSRFIANVSYELRTPLSSIIGYTNLVLDGTYGALNDKQRDRLEKVARNSQHLLRLINDVLDLNRIEGRGLLLAKKPVPTARVLDQVLATIEPLAQAKELAIHRAYEAAPPVLADEMRLQQIVTNIISNAVKFTPQGSVTVRAGWDDTGKCVCIAVADTGIGISPEDQDKVFLEFEQVDSSSTRVYGGTGLGLAITKRLVELHGGRIWLESTVQRGTVVFVLLPAAQSRNGTPSASEPSFVQK